MAEKPDLIRVFLSYARADYDLVPGNIARVRDEIRHAIKAALGQTSELLLQMDSNIHGLKSSDRTREAENGEWFLVPLLAPFYFDSAKCREEATAFLDLESKAGRRDLIFPVYLVDVDVLEDEKRRSGDAIAKAFYERPLIDWRATVADEQAKQRIEQLAADLAEQIKAASERNAGEAPPNIPEQGHGVRFRVNEDGLIDRAPDEPHDADENAARLKSLQSGLTEACDRLLGSSGHNTLGFVLDVIRAYREAIDRPLADVQYTDVWRHGQRLQNLADAATREVDRMEPSLEDDQHAALNDLLDLHGPFMLSTSEGRELQAMADRYQATREQQARQKEAVQAFKEAIEDSTGLVTDAVKQVIAEASDGLGKGRYPERAAITSETTNRNFLSTAGKAAAYVGNHAAGGIIGGVAVGTVLGSGIVGVSIEALNVAGQASTQFILSHQMMLKGLVASSTDSLAWLNHLIAWLGRRAPASTVRPAPEDASAIVTNDFWTPGRVFRDIDEPWCPEMVVIPAGEFLMGSPKDEEGRKDREGPRHRVTIAKPFALGRYPVTFDEFDYFCEEMGHAKPSDEGWGRGRRPVINIYRKNALEYCEWLSKKTEKRYKLPSEAFWEYACRAHSNTPYSFGSEINKKQATFGIERSHGKTSIVGDYPANAFGLFDMHGNIWELCDDCYHQSYVGAPNDGKAWIENDLDIYVMRGGAWFNEANILRSSFRAMAAPDDVDKSWGFRCARVLE